MTSNTNHIEEEVIKDPIIVEDIEPDDADLDDDLEEEEEEEEFDED